MQKNTSVTLGSHFEQFIRQQVQNGRYGAADKSRTPSHREMILPFSQSLFDRACFRIA